MKKVKKFFKELTISVAVDLVKGVVLFMVKMLWWLIVPFIW